MKIVEYTPSKYVTLNLVHQIDHNNAVVKFDGIAQSDENNVVYFILGTDKKSFKIPLKDMSFKVTSPMTDISGMLKGQIREYAPDGSFIDNLTDIFPVLIRDSIDGDIIEVTDPRIDLWFDAMQKLYNEVKDEYESGALNGKDGVGIKSIEKTKSESLVDTYTITLTDDSTFVYSVTNGRDGIDGKSAYEIAVQNGFEGTEEEWLKSLRYDHSDEFKQLADQVKLDAKNAADSATKAESAMNEANATAQANVKAIQKASTTAQGEITTSKNNAVKAVQDAQATAEEAIGDKQIEAVQAVDTAKTSATTEITEQKENALTEITNEKNSATEAIETGKTDALEIITTAKDNAIEEIENTGIPLEDIEKLAIKENAEGNPTIISDSADWRLQSLNVYDRSEQDSTTGVQLFDILKATPRTNNFGLTVTIDGDYILINGSVENLSRKIFRIINTDVSFEGKICKAFDVTTTNCSIVNLVPSVGESNIVIHLNVTALENISCKFKLMVSDTEPISYEPYTGGKPSPSPNYPQEIIPKEISEIKVRGKNKLPFPFTLLTQEVTKNGLTFTPQENGGIKINGTCTIDNLSLNLDNYQYEEGYTCTLWYENGTEYNQSVTTVIMRHDNVNNFVYLHIPTLGTTFNNLVLYPMETLESMSDSYEPYKEQKITLQDPITLYGVPVNSDGNVTLEGNQYIADILKEKDGVIGIDRNIELLTMTGANSESWLYYLTIGTIQKEPCFVMSNSSEYKSGQLGYCERYIEHSLPITNGQCHMRSAYAGEGRISICDSTFLSLEEWKQHLSENPLKATFLLKEPIFEPLPEEVQTQYKALKSYYPNTVIQTGCWNEVEYVADTKTWIENKINGVTELALGIGGK